MPRHWKILLGLGLLVALAYGGYMVVLAQQGVRVVDAMDLRPYDCYRNPPLQDTEIHNMHVVECQEQHDGQVFAVLLGGRDVDGNFDRCAAAWEPAGPLGEPPAHASLYTITEKLPRDFDSPRVICTIASDHGLVGSLFAAST